MEITTVELKEKINSGEKILIDFWGTFCGPCKVLKPMFESASEKLKEDDINLYTFNIDNDRDFVINELNIRSVPTIKGFKDGKVVYTKVGMMRTEEIIDIAKEI